jgi:hypothetical protein
MTRRVQQARPPTLQANVQATGGSQSGFGFERRPKAAMGE